jgi:hypothetical protein
MFIRQCRIGSHSPRTKEWLGHFDQTPGDRLDRGDGFDIILPRAKHESGTVGFYAPGGGTGDVANGIRAG